MRQTAVAGAIAVAVAAFAGVCGAQEKDPTMDDVLRELQRLRERVDKLEDRHVEDQDRIRQLEGRPPEAQRPPVAEPPPPRPAPARSLPPAEIPPSATDLTLALPAQGITGQGNLYNPAITAFFDMGFSLSTNDANPAYNRFNLREIELDIRAAITPWADGVLVLAFGEHVETSGGSTEIHLETEIEEGYIYFHTLPWDLALKGGKFRAPFGINNLLHTHDLPQVDRPLIIPAFLGGHGLSTLGASLNWLVPNPWDRYIEVTGAIINADGGHEAPILGGPDADNPAFLAHLKYNDDAGDYGFFEIGGSYLYSHTSADSDFDANVFGLDATLMLPDANAPDLRSLLLQSEFFWASNDLDLGPGSFRNDSFGFYAYAQYQFLQNWYTGVRFDYTEYPAIPDRNDWAISPYLSWYLTEFLRLRAQYQHRESQLAGVWDAEDDFFFQITFCIGAHPAHPYWVNR